MLDAQILANILIVLQLVALEGILSFDNALALSALVKKKLKDPVEQKKALIWGIWGAYVFRILVIFIGVWLMKFEWIKAIAGIYLIIIAVCELFIKKDKKVSLHEITITKSKATPLIFNRVFVMTVVQVEIMDILFSIDSIAVALAISDVKWVLITGTVLGVFFMRVAAQFLSKFIDKFPLLIPAAFILMAFAGLNVLLKLKGLNLGFTTLTIDKPIPEFLFLTIMFGILIIAVLLDKFALKKFKS